MVIEGRFIIGEGNSDHLFQPGDFVKEDAVPLLEDGHSCEPIDPLLAPVRMVEGQFDHGSDEHLFQPEDF